MSDITPSKQPNTLNAIEKTLSVIDFISNHETTFAEIQKSLCLPKATLHRILQALELHEFIKKDDLTDCYKLGLKFIYYGESVKANTDLPSIVSDYLESFSREIGESSCLSVLYQNMVLTLSSFEGDSSALTSRLVPFSPLNCSASGKIFLSNFSDNRLTEYFESNAPIQKTLNSICSYDEFIEEKRKIKEKGISYDDEEYEYGLFCMSVPLHNHLGPINATIGITGPKARIFMKDLSSIEQELKSISEEISGQLKKIKYLSEY